MFEREIKFIYDFNLNKVNKLGPYFTFEELQNSGIHPAILHYISAEIDFLIFDDRQKLLKNSVFDYSGENINSLFIKINEEIKKSKRFSLDYISKLILRSISFTINFLVRPKWTLNKFIFDDYDHKTAVEVKQILNYIYYYKYLNKILIAYIDTKKLLSINSSEFAQITNKIERLGIETYLNVIINDALKAMGEFFNIGEIQKNKVPITAFKYFLSEKELGVHINKIDENFPKDESSKVSIAELKKVLDKIEPYKIYEKEATLFDEPQDNEEDTTIESLEEPIPENEPALNFNLNFNINKELLEDPKLDIENNREDEVDLGEDSTEEEDIENYDEDKIKKDFSQSIHDEETEEDSEIDEIQNDILNEDFNEEEYIENDDNENEIEMISEKEINIVENDINENESNDLKNGDYESPPQIDFIDELEKYIPDEIKVESNIEQYRDENYPAEEFDENEEDELKDELEIEDDIINDTENTEDIIEITENEDNENNESDEIENKIEEYNSIFDPTELNKVESHVEIDIAELLEHKNMTKVIEVIFDYDVEEFTNTIEEVCKCRNLDDALLVLNEKIKQHYADVNSKEASQFREIITEYYNKAD